MLRRFLRGVALAAALTVPVATIMPAALAASAADAPDDVPTAWQYLDWRVACPATTQKSSCTLTLEALDAAKKTVLARLTIYRKDGADILIVTLPYNILLEPGTKLDFADDAKEPVYPFQDCDSEGCIARMPFGGALARELEHAAQGRILFADLGGKPAYIPLSSQGFGRAYAAYLREEARR